MRLKWSLDFGEYCLKPREKLLGESIRDRRLSVVLKKCVTLFSIHPGKVR